MKIWSKTILSVYKYLEALANSIDDLVMKKSINSAFYSSYRFYSCYDVANKIMQLTERKINLINIKVLSKSNCIYNIRKFSLTIFSYICSRCIKRTYHGEKIYSTSGPADDRASYVCSVWGR